MDYSFVLIVIPTFNRAGSLIRCLDSLASQDCPADRFEIIVVGDGSDPSEVERISRHIDFVASIDVRLLIQGENTGPAAARNRGIESARGDVIGFVDDDCICDKGWICSAVARLTRNPDLASVEGWCATVTWDTSNSHLGHWGRDPSPPHRWAVAAQSVDRTADAAGLPTDRRRRRQLCH